MNTEPNYRILYLALLELCRLFIKSKITFKFFKNIVMIQMLTHNGSSQEMEERAKVWLSLCKETTE